MPAYDKQTSLHCLLLNPSFPFSAKQELIHLAVKRKKNKNKKTKGITFCQEEKNPDNNAN